MTSAAVEKPILYPESDGKPMAETDVHDGENEEITQWQS
jgi:hypothetical protein